MTNEEIKLKIAGHLSTHSYGVGSNILPLVGLVQSLVAQAYEESANIAAANQTEYYEGDAATEIAHDVRALKDSLLLETIPSN